MLSVIAFKVTSAQHHSLPKCDVRNWSALRYSADFPFFTSCSIKIPLPAPKSPSSDSLLNCRNTGKKLLPNLSPLAWAHLYSARPVRTELACLRVRHIKVAKVGYIRLWRGRRRETFAMAGQDAAPARGARNPASGTPRVTVRSNYVGLPLMAGRGPDERGRKPAGSGRAEAPRPGPEVRSRGAKSPKAIKLAQIA
jgi:hypothetical protein